jgi:Na+-translocating ferredoxin:NAD+ oxidoreductase RnfD subunit
MPAHNASQRLAHHNNQIHPAFPCFELGYITRPDLILAGGIIVLIQKVMRYRIAVLAFFCHLVSNALGDLQVKLSHQLAHLITTNIHAFFA